MTDQICALSDEKWGKSMEEKQESEYSDRERRIDSFVAQFLALSADEREEVISTILLIEDVERLSSQSGHGGA